MEQGHFQRPTSFPLPGRKQLALACFLLGGFGFHKFLLRKHMQGLLYLLFCWTLIPWLSSLIDGFILLNQDDAEYAEELLEDETYRSEPFQS